MAAKWDAVSKSFSASQQIFFRQQPKLHSFRAGLEGRLHRCRLHQKAFTILCRRGRPSADERHGTGAFPIALKGIKHPACGARRLW